MSADDQNAGGDARGYVDNLLARAVRAEASDVHVEPVGGEKAEVKFRIDGLLERVEFLPESAGRSAVLRLMVMAQLLTYKLDIPQEGRIRMDGTGNGTPLDLRLAVIPVAHGMRAVVRLPAELTMPRDLEALGLPDRCLAALHRFVRNDAGMLLVTGPAGSGKTTTIYALLTYLAKTSPGISIISLEDPIERIVPGITQIEVAPHGQLTYERALKSILRQDPQVLVLGEIRDASTASLAVQAALSGHRLIATLHAGDPAGAITRLLEMGLEPYQVSSSVYGILSQRLMRKCRGMGVPPMNSAEGPHHKTSTLPGAAESLSQNISPITHRRDADTISFAHRRDADATSPYKGRVVIAEFGALDDDLRRHIVAHADAATLRKSFHRQEGHATLRAIADRLVQAGISDSGEIARVLGD